MQSSLIINYKHLDEQQQFIVPIHRQQKNTRLKKSQFLFSANSYINTVYITISSQIANKNIMKQQTSNLDHLPAYLIKINTAAFKSKGNSVLQRTKEEYLPKYWEKLQMDQKKIGPSCEDRLTNLNTNQIDRIIDMQKIQNSLQYTKKKLAEPTFTFKVSHPNSHSNTYKACFIAKINNIAIKRNIQPERADLGIFVGEDSSTTHNKMAPVPFKYQKKYLVDKKSRKRSKTEHYEEDEVKSIASIKDQLEVFEENLKKNRNTRVDFRCRKKTAFPNSVTKRWFYGLSDHYISKTPKMEPQPVLSRSSSIDISSQLSSTTIPHSRHKHNKSHSTDISASPSLSLEPLQKYRTYRVVTVQ